MIGTVSWFKRWIVPLAVAAMGAGSLAGAIWYRAAVPVITMPGSPAATVTETVALPPQTAVETRTAVATVTATPEQAPAKREVITEVRAAKPETVTETVTKTREGETVTETATETEQVLQAVERGDGNRGN